MVAGQNVTEFGTPTVCLLIGRSGAVNWWQCGFLQHHVQVVEVLPESLCEGVDADGLLGVTLFAARGSLL